MLVNLRALFGAIVDIMLFRRGPDSLPTSVGLLVGLIVVNGALAAFLVSAFGLGSEMSIVELIAGVAVPLAWYWVAFRLANKPERFVQTMTAFFGVNVLLQPIVAPLLASLAPYMVKPDPAVPPPAALSLLFFVVFVWAMCVWLRVVRAAFEWPYFAVIIFVIAQAFFTLSIDRLFFGTPPAPV